ncbi:hypothetical protein [Puerhibacterium puerhi]|uniref:hypothetical protein n=1 Tax=Puerhibacterium puerhi TaxID=2692623 RepID=UPI00135B63DD|nr:hypothetical protein [Puerhibacterium puerhi]
MAANLQRVAERKAQTYDALVTKLIAALWNLWATATPSQLWDDTFAWGRAARSAVLVESALRQAQRQSRSYAMTALRSLDAAPSQIDPVEYIYPRFDTTTLEAYQRPATAGRWAWSQGHQGEAMDAVRDRIEQLVEADVRAIDNREQRDTYAATPTVTGYRRVIHPELSTSGTCGLCIAAASRFYSVRDLMPMHDRCRCETLPIVGDEDPGLQLNDDDLARLYGAAGGTGRQELARVRIQTVENGELGPILAPEGQKHRGPAAAGHRRYREPNRDDQHRSWQRMRETSQTWADQLERAAATGRPQTFTYLGRDYTVEANPEALRYHRALVERMTANLQAA